MVQIKCLSNGLYSLKNSHIPFGMGFQPPALTAEFRLNSTCVTRGLPLVYHQHSHTPASLERTGSANRLNPPWFTSRRTYDTLRRRKYSLKENQTVSWFLNEQTSHILNFQPVHWGFHSSKNHRPTRVAPNHSKTPTFPVDLVQLTRSRSDVTVHLQCLYIFLWNHPSFIM